METWDLLQSGVGTPAINMATDEVLHRTAPQRRRPLLRIYSWSCPAITIGYFQKFPAADRPVVRRPTGGGLVHHGTDTTYTVIAPPGHPLYKLRTNAAYCAIHQAVSFALNLQSQISNLQSAPRGQYECFQNPVAGDVVAGNKKLAGGAQRRNRDGMLHQGSIAAHVPDLPAGFARQFSCDFQPYALTGEEHAMIDWLATGKYTNDAWNRRL